MPPIARRSGILRADRGPSFGGEPQSELIGRDNGLRAVPRTECPQHGTHVNLDRTFGQVEFATDQLVGQTFEDQPEHIALTAREAQTARVALRHSVRRTYRGAPFAADHFLGDIHVAGCNQTQGVPDHIVMH